MSKEGIFRKSPSSEELRFVKNAFNIGDRVDLSGYEIDISAALLKVFIRELPTPLIDLKFNESMGALPGKNINLFFFMTDIL
jgi:hypothetical protein